MAVERKQTLRDLTDNENLILQLLEQSEDWEDEDAAKRILEATLAATAVDRKEKVDRTYYAMRSLEARAKLLQAEEKHLAGMRRTAQNQAERLKGYLRLIAQEQGLAKGEPVRFEGELHRITVSEGGFSVHVVDAKAIPDHFQVVVPATMRLDRKGIAAHIKAGRAVPEGVRTEKTITVRFR